GVGTRVRAVVARRTGQARPHRRELARPGAAAGVGRGGVDGRRSRPAPQERDVSATMSGFRWKGPTPRHDWTVTRHDWTVTRHDWTFTRRAWTWRRDWRG